MFMNLGTLPPEMSLYTLYVAEPGWARLAPDERTADEVDVVAPTRNGWRGAIDAATGTLTELYAGAEVIGVVDQSRGEVLFQANSDGAGAIVY